MVGTLSVPPPMPIIAETAPMIAGIAAPPTPPGTERRSTTWSSGSSILSAATSATQPKTAASTRASMRAAASEPASEPSTIGTDQRFISSKSTEPRFACESRGGDGRRDDGGHRGRHRDVQGRARWHACDLERRIEHRDDHDAAADAEQPGEQPAQGARGDDRGEGRQPVQERTAHDGTRCG